MTRALKTMAFLLALVAIVAGAAAWYWRKGNSETVSYRTVAVTRGDLTATISATGTLEPEELVDVGAQVAGQISSFGKDKNGKTIDYGSEVEEGMVLAKIDDSLYAADEATAEAQYQAALAGVKKAEADVEQMRAKLLQAQRDWDRAKKLGPSDALAQSNYDAYEAGYEQAKANVDVGMASVTQAKASVAQAEANLKRAKRNLGYCTITSPVNGVIIDRRVNAGQTVVASLNAPSLFLIAKDLKRMQVWVSVNEADIGSIHPEQPATFTVDAFPGETFRGTVSKVRLNATMTQNVVVYTVEITTDNASGKLLPYLTANVRFQVASREDVLMVPNVALRWTPASNQQIAPEARDAGSGEAGAAGGTKRSHGTTQPAEGQANQTRREGGEREHGTVWVQEGTFVKPIRVRVGLTDGLNTEVSSDQLSEGMQVVSGEAKGDQASDDARNPFLPQFPGRKQGSGSGGPGSGGGPGGGGRSMRGG